jgi:hypothetical protein
MNDKVSATEQATTAMRASYTDLLMSVPLVAIGILITGSIFYLMVVRPKLAETSFSGWTNYLVPKEYYTSRSAKVDFWVWLINGLLVIPIYEACVILAGLFVGVGAYDILASLFGPGLQAVQALWAVVLIQFLSFYLSVGIGQYAGHFLPATKPGTSR